MKILKLSILIIYLLTNVLIAKAQLALIPQPQKISLTQGAFQLSKNIKIIAQKETQTEANYLAEKLGKVFGNKIEIKKKGKGISLIIDNSLLEELGPEGYSLTVDSDEIKVTAPANAGIFYGIQSLRQLLPADFEYKTNYGTPYVEIPYVSIKDYPRFGWRAFMLDEARHFQGTKTVKDLLDQMALLKMNVFHWHLTDDQGWRIEIKKYPKLTEVGGFRSSTQITRNHPEDQNGIPHGGFYTQKQIKEIIEYAKQRHIRIVPEIEMPGHAMAAITAYPWLGVVGTSKEVPGAFGKLEDSFNVADPNVYKFLEDVLSEVFALFPGQVVHIGGDEVKFDAWKNSEMMKKLMQKEDLQSPADVQIYFTNRISNFIDQTGHRMMGWNEILGYNVHEWQKDSDFEVKQQLAKSAIIHFWKGDLELIKQAASSGYDVVNSTYWNTYLDYNYEATPLSRAYNYDPIPQGLDEKYENKILGLGCQLWTEWVPSRKKLDRQVFPRLAAYAEVGWTNKNQKDWTRFSQSLEQLKQRWILEGIDFATDVEK